MELSIFECQPGMFCRPTGESPERDSGGYVYRGYDRARGLHKFEQGGRIEYFARRKSPPASWHLKRGAWTFEFVSSTQANADFSVMNHGSIFTLLPLTDAGRQWCDEHLPEDAQRLGAQYAIEHRYIQPILEGIAGDGLVFR